eukprot:Clim_evm28s247 gene=Clim_evmTU28s247
MDSSASEVSADQYFRQLSTLCSRMGPVAAPDEEPQLGMFETVRDIAKILVIGAGGLGCELLKDLALMGFKHLEVIDMDTIDVSNLNRQFLFRASDVGKPKATVAAEFINTRTNGRCKVTAYYGRIEDHGPAFYSQFNIIVCGLDSIAARRWINGMLFSLLEYDDEGKVCSGMIPMVDAGTEGFKGHARVILPGMSACFECALPSFPPQEAYPLCTIASTPRIPEHCIEWAKIIAWPESFKDEELDLDSPKHLQWLYEKSCERAKEFDIQGVTMRLTLGVAKNIIPAIASTNAAMAAVIAHEVFKLAMSCCLPMNNYLMYNGSSGVYCFTFEYERNPDCLVCGKEPVVLTVEDFSKTSLEQLLTAMAEHQSLQTKQPSVRCAGKSLYLRKPPMLEQQTRPNLGKTLAELGVASGASLDVTDPAIPKPLQVIVRASS